MMSLRTKRGSRTIKQFSRQFKRYEKTGNQKISADPLETGKSQDELFIHRIIGISIQGKRVMEVGAGMGRWSAHLFQAKPSLLIIVEPTDAVNEIERRLPSSQDVTTIFIQKPIEQVSEVEVDVVVSIGVLHHISDQKAALQVIRRSLAPRGICVLWVYKRPDSYVVFGLIRAIRLLSRPCPDSLLALAAKVISILLVGYGSISAAILGRFPFHRYCADNFRKLDQDDRELTIYDQLRPRVATYFSENALYRLLDRSGFKDIDIQPFGEVALVARCIV
jgi:2-polyprenyl-3-methyl-5-hydroxy-6-metoxy-1,4-benzoquinol methylase